MGRRFAIRDEVRRLDPEKDHQRIVFLSTCFDFPFDTTRALEFALFRTYCVPSISALLDSTGEFQNRTQKRYDDTDIIVSEMLEHGYDSQRGSRALRRMNQIHGRFTISNEDFQYVLSTFVYEPIRWNERFGWRPMCEQERLAMYYFWREVGRRMNIQNIPPDFDAFDRFNRAYEREHYRFTESNHRVGKSTRDLYVSWFPGFLAPVVRSTIHALLDDPLIEAFGFPAPPPLLRWLVPAGLRLRARVLRWCPPRTKPRLRTEGTHRSYPEGYAIETLGPTASRDVGRPKDVALEDLDVARETN